MLINIIINECRHKIKKGHTLFDIKNELYPEADVAVLNGYPADLNSVLKENDTVVFIKKGKIPSLEEFKYQLYARHTPGVQKIFEKATVGIAGLGGLGSTVAVALARIGIGTLIISDFDIVEPSNLNRQQYFSDQIGMFKTDALKETIQRINPFINILSHNHILSEHNIYRIFSKCDILIEAFDSVEMKHTIKKCFEDNFKDAFLIMGSGMAGYYSSLSIKIEKLSSNIYVVGDFINSAKQGCGLMSPRVGIVASMQANTAVRLLLKNTEP